MQSDWIFFGKNGNNNYSIYNVSKASYAIQVPHVGDAAKTSHLLPEHIIDRVVADSHRPLNPHKQRLLAASTRAVATPKAHTAPTKKPAMRTSSAAKKKEALAKADPESSRSAYSASKRDFMEKLLGQLV